MRVRKKSRGIKSGSVTAAVKAVFFQCRTLVWRASLTAAASFTWFGSPRHFATLLLLLCFAPTMVNKRLTMRGMRYCRELSGNIAGVTDRGCGLVRL